MKLNGLIIIYFFYSTQPRMVSSVADILMADGNIEPQNYKKNIQKERNTHHSIKCISNLNNIRYIHKFMISLSSHSHPYEKTSHPISCLWTQFVNYFKISLPISIISGFQFQFQCPTCCAWPLSSHYYLCYDRPIPIFAMSFQQSSPVQSSPPL